MKYLLGVDGGNSKTEYLLCAEDGSFADVYRTGTCSHERFDDDYDGMERVMREQLAVILGRNKITVADIAAAGFGLAGADLPHQVEELKKRVEAIGIKRYGLANDGILGVKGASESGVGVCAVNGTGTVVVGIDTGGKILQVGGMGHGGDGAGGGFIRGRIITSTYCHYYRCGEYSSMFPEVLKLLDTTQEGLNNIISNWSLLSRHMTEIIQIGFKAAEEGDNLARKIFDDVGISAGQAVSGCIHRLNFADMGTDEKPIDIVQVGSIWNKIPYDGMHNSFVKTIDELSGKVCRVRKLETTVAVGGALWAKELVCDAFPSTEYRKKLVKTITKVN
jgi:N-acetylglucosamine kinase-like BadF-type ATPase